MGAYSCRLCDDSAVSNGDQGASTWRLGVDRMEMLCKYTQDGTVDQNCSNNMLEFRSFLDSPIALRHLILFSMSRGCDGIISLWMELQEWNKSEIFRRSQLVSLLERHVDLGFLKVHNGNVEEYRPIPDILSALATCEGESKYLQTVPANPQAIFQDLRRQCLQQLLQTLYIPFTQTEAYHIMRKVICDADSWVHANSFDYGEVIAKGSFGVVVRCRKKTTGVEFAMKIQPKSKLLSLYSRHNERVMTEMQAYCEFDHPFVTTLSYALQTSSLVMLVMPIAICGDLAKSMRLTGVGFFDTDRVRCGRNNIGP